jgi:predicted dehydrogenase
MKDYNRRRFLKTTAISAAALTAASRLSASSPPKSKGKYMGNFSAPKLETVRVAFIGLGARGSGHLKSISKLDGVDVVAVSDLYEDNVKINSKIAKELGKGERHRNIAQYWGSDDKWKLMLNEIRPDAVFISTNWNNHAPMAIYSMQNGAHAFVEVPIAVSLSDMWKIVNTSEETQKHCMMMENVNYGRDELMYLNMCRKGVIGELLHAEAAYIHELRFQMNQENRGTGSWRTHHYANGKGNLYPTHGLGPVAQYMNLGRKDDTFESIISYSSPARGRKLYAEKNYNENHKWNQLDYRNGDMNTSIIKTNKGKTVMVQWDETSPRPYTRHNLVQGTKGTLAGFPTRVALEGGLEGVVKDHHSWIKGDGLIQLYEKYDHPLYKRLNQKTKNSGHGGMDGIMRYRIIECLRNGLPLDQNVYEGCYWSAVTPLSGQSISDGGMPQKFPDFTRGKWEQTNPLEIIN